VEGEEYMIKKLLGVILLAGFFAHAAYAGEQVLTESLSSSSPATMLADGKGNIWVGYYDKFMGIHARNVSQGTDLLIGETAEKTSRGLTVDIQGEHIFVVWREKASGRKKLFFRASHDGGKTLSDPVILDDNTTEALTRIKIGSNPKGEVYVLWYGEKKILNADYNIYVASSTDFGKTFSAPKNLTEGYTHSIYPALLVDDENAYTFSYSISIDERKTYMVFRKTSDGGKTWSEPVRIKETGTVSLYVEPVKVGKRLHVFWFNSYDSAGNSVIEGAYSDDDGKTWKSTVFEATRRFDVGTLKVSNDRDGHIYLTMAGKWEEKQKSKAYILISEDNGTTWRELISVRHYPFEHTKVKIPTVLADAGEVVVVWQDYRNIRSNLYMQFSKDGGKTWQEKDIPLEEPGKFNTGLWIYGNSILRVKDKYYVLAYRSENDLLEKELLLLVDFTLK
jgi:hypothetical protein